MPRGRSLTAPNQWRHDEPGRRMRAPSGAISLYPPPKAEAAIGPVKWHHGERKTMYVITRPHLTG